MSTVGGLTITAASAGAVKPGGSGATAPDLSGPSLYAIGSGWSATATLVNYGNGNDFWIGYARIQRNTGSASYSTHAHAALNEYNKKSDWQNDPSSPSYQWGYTQASCASANANNATAQTCSSNHRSAGNRFFWSASGYEFHQGTSNWTPTIDIYEQCNSGNCAVV